MAISKSGMQVQYSQRTISHGFVLISRKCKLLSLTERGEGSAVRTISLDEYLSGFAGVPRMGLSPQPCAFARVSRTVMPSALRSPSGVRHTLLAGSAGRRPAPAPQQATSGIRRQAPAPGSGATSRHLALLGFFAGGDDWRGNGRRIGGSCCRRLSHCRCLTPRHGSVSSRRSPNRTGGFTASGSPVGSCVSHTEHPGNRGQQVIGLAGAAQLPPCGARCVRWVVEPVDASTTPHLERPRFLHLGM